MELKNLYKQAIESNSKMIQHLEIMIFEAKSKSRKQELIKTVCKLNILQGRYIVEYNKFVLKEIGDK